MVEEQGQIIRLYADVATVQLSDEGDSGPKVEGTIRGKLFRDDPPAVGDWVTVEKRGNTYVITGVLPRKSVLARRAAGKTVRRQVLIANVDRVMVAFAAAKPDPALSMLDRFLVVAEVNNLEAHIVVNKMDLANKEETRAMFAAYEKAGYPVHYTSVKAALGMEKLRGALEGAMSVFVGPSGVGKSSLLNALYPGLNLKVGEISAAYGTGRHTTVGGLLVKLPGGGAVADTAGLREVGFWLIPPNELPDCFPEMRPYMDDCQFSDCAHLTEPGCRVREAVEGGEIDEARYESYRQLRAEAVETWPRW
jgi:ribosome biogenesis GTPase